MAFDIQRVVEFDFLRATQIAALNCMQWIGKGNKEAADAAACDAIRGMLDLTDIRGEVVIGEGIKDEAPGIFKGERLGMWRDGHRGSKSGTVRYLTTEHNREKKTIHLRSSIKEVPI